MSEFTEIDEISGFLLDSVGRLRDTDEQKEVAARNALANILALDVGELPTNVREVTLAFTAFMAAPVLSKRIAVKEAGLATKDFFLGALTMYRLIEKEKGVLEEAAGDEE